MEDCSGTTKNAALMLMREQKRNHLICQHLRTFAPIVSVHPYCKRNSLRDVMPHHALNARAECVVEVSFFNFSALASSNSTIIEAARCSFKFTLEVEFN